MSTTPPWRLLRSGPLTGALNMALDQVLLEAVAAGTSAPVLRLYQWSPATLTLGFAQRGPGLADLAACREAGVEVVRRITGGRAVLHDREVTYAVIASERSNLFPGGILANYRVIAAILQRTLAALGLPTDLASSRPAPSQGGVIDSACFTAPATSELLHAGCKVTGSAQKRHRGAFLQHGSLPLDLDLELLFKLLNTSGKLPTATGVRLLNNKVGWLNRWLPQPITANTLEEQLVKSFTQGLGVRLEADEPSSSEWAAARLLVQERYTNPAWTWQELRVDRADRRDYVYRTCPHALEP